MVEHSFVMVQQEMCELELKKKTIIIHDTSSNPGIWIIVLPKIAHGPPSRKARNSSVGGTKLCGKVVNLRNDMRDRM